VHAGGFCLLGGRVYGDGWGLREAGGAGRIGGTGRGRLSAPEPAALSPRLAVPFLCCVTGRGTKKAPGKPGAFAWGAQLAARSSRRRRQLCEAHMPAVTAGRAEQ
jgi:hypothetical protein